MKILEILKELWDALDYVPDCPACHGTGRPTHPYENWAQTVLWHGKPVKVCHNCMGAGKV